MAVRWEWLLSLEEEEDSGAESRLPGNVRGDPSAVSAGRGGTPVRRLWVCRPESPPLTVQVRRLRSQGLEGLAEVTLLLSDEDDPDLEVRWKPERKRGSKQMQFAFFQRTFCSKPCGNLCCILVLFWA